MITVLENEKGKLKLEVHDDITFVSVLNEYIWKLNPKFSAFSKEHFYLTNPVLTVRSRNPKNDVINAAKKLLVDLEALKREISRL